MMQYWAATARESFHRLGLLIACCIACCGVTRLSSAEVSLLDGSQLSGEIVAITTDTVELAGATKPTPWREIDRLRFARKTPHKPAAPAKPATTPIVLLKDGSYLPVNSGTKVSAIKNGVHVATRFGALDLPLGVVVAWGEATWIARKRSEQTDIVRLDGSEISGSIQGINDGKLFMKTDLAPEPIPLPLSGILGIHLAIAVDRPRGIYLSTPTDATLPPLILVPTDKGFVLQSFPKINISVDHLSEVTVHGGRRVFLSDLKPSYVNEEGAFGVVWNYATNQNIDGSPLILAGKRHGSGLVIHSKAELEWQLDAAYTTFSSNIGIVDLMGREGDCSLRILGDGKMLWEQASIKGGGTPHVISLDVSAVATLRVEVGYGARYDIADHLAFANAWLLKK